MAESPRPRRDALVDRARGSLLGLAVGEALGRPVEALSREQACADLAEGPRLASGLGDQTAMAILVAESLLKQGRLAPTALAQDLQAWIRQGPRDVGHVAARAFYLQGQGQPWADAARTAWEEQQPRSAGAEGLARTAPLALRVSVADEVLARDSLAASAVTHFDPRCRWSAAAFSLMIAHFLRGAGQGLPGSILGLVSERHVRGALEEMPTLVWGQLQARNEAPLALQAATWCVLNESGFPSALRAAVSLGGAAPLVGAVCGALAGARFGSGQIPAEWLAAVPDAKRLIELAERLTRQESMPTTAGLPPERRNGEPRLPND